MTVLRMVDDLSTRHGLISDLFPLLQNPGEWAKYRLSQEQLEFYQEYGYLSGIRMLTDEQVEVLRGALTDLIRLDHPGHHLFYEFHSNESADPSMVLFHALGAWRISPGFHDLLWNPAFTVPASQLLGGPVRFWHDQLFCKPPHPGGVVAWHQDYSYWTRSRPMAHLSCWIGLDDSTVENGCLHYVPGSHRWHLLPITGLANDMDAIQTALTEEQRAEFRPVPIELERGFASFHHPLMVHGSYGNTTDQSRRAVVINVFRDGVRSASDSPLLEGVPAIPSGQPIGGRFFPVLFDPRELTP